MKPNWKIKEAAPDNFFSLFSTYPRFFTQALWNRGIQTRDTAEHFLNPSYERDAHDPFLFRDMEKAVARIGKAVAEKERIVVWGDYDCDGVCGSTIIWDTLRKLGHERLTDVYIPDRNTEGYGLNIPNLEEAVRGGAKLLITVDCGITDHAEIRFARAHGVDVIIADHHIVPDVVPDAYAILNPKDPRSGYPFTGLAGTGAAFKLALALLPDASYQRPATEFLDLVAIATLADTMPLRDENRAIVHEGLRGISKTERIGLRALLRFCELADKDLTTRDILFSIVPRLNAMGRMDHASVSFRLLATPSEEEAEVLIRHLDEKNRERQMVTDIILEEVRERLGRYPAVPHFIFESADHWTPGVLGLAAQRTLDRYKRSVILTTGKENRIVGNGRALPGHNLVETMRKQPELFVDFGGHPRAAGFTIEPKNLEAVQKLFLDDEAGHRNEEAEIPADGELSPQELTLAACALLQRLAPFGEENPEPQFLVRNLIVKDARQVGKNRDHLKLKLGANDSAIGAIGFGLGDRQSALRAGDRIDVVAHLSENVWNGSRAPQLQLVDISIHG